MSYLWGSAVVWKKISNPINSMFSELQAWASRMDLPSFPMQCEMHADADEYTIYSLLGSKWNNNFPLWKRMGLSITRHIWIITSKFSRIVLGWVAGKILQHRCCCIGKESKPLLTGNACSSLYTLGLDLLSFQLQRQTFILKTAPESFTFITAMRRHQ